METKIMDGSVRVSKRRVAGFIAWVLMYEALTLNTKSYFKLIFSYTGIARTRFYDADTFKPTHHQTRTTGI